MTKSELIQLAAFEGKEIRKILHEGEWWFSIIDIVEVLTGSSIPKRYWSDLKKKLVAEGFSETYEKIVRLKMNLPRNCGQSEKLLQTSTEDCYGIEKKVIHSRVQG